MTARYIVSLYAAGKRHASDCLPEFFASREAAIEAGAAECARVAAIEPADRIRTIDWARRFTVRRAPLAAWERTSA